MLKHPYSNFTSSEAWKIIQQSLEDLVVNNDIEIKTLPEYVIGYLVKNLSKNKLLLEDIKKENHF
jgi:hypothetical protein